MTTETQMIDEYAERIESLVDALEATQPLLQLAMHEAQKRNDMEFLTRLQTSFAANLAALKKADGG